MYGKGGRAGGGSHIPRKVTLRSFRDPTELGVEFSLHIHTHQTCNHPQRNPSTHQAERGKNVENANKDHGDDDDDKVKEEW